MFLTIKELLKLLYPLEVTETDCYIPVLHDLIKYIAAISSLYIYCFYKMFSLLIGGSSFSNSMLLHGQLTRDEALWSASHDEVDKLIL